MLICIYAVFSLISVVQMLRFSVAGPMVYISTFSFVIVATLVILATAAFLWGIDWSQVLDVGSVLASPFALPQ